MSIVKRIKKTGVLLSLLLLCSTVAFAQLTQYVIGGSGNEIATRVRYLPTDGSTIVAGYSYDITGGAVSNAQMALVKVTASGTIAWQKKFGVAGTSNVIQDMIITHDGNIVVVGTVGRATIYTGNVAAIMKFNATDGSLMWQKCMSATPVNTGGELYFGVTELGATKSYELVAVGGSNFYPGLSSGLIGVYQSDGTLIYNDVYNVAGTGYLNGVTQNTDSSGVYICGVFPGDYTDGSVFSYTPGTTTGTVNWSQYLDFYLEGSLQNNFLSDIYLSGSQLVIQGTSGENYSSTIGQGQFVLTMNASDGTGQQVYGIQNSGTSFANNAKIAVISPDHVFAIQSPYTSIYDASLWTSGITTNTVITEITSLSAGTSNPPVKLTSGDVGEHSIYDMRIRGGSLYLAGATNVSSGFGNNDIYLVIAGSSLASTNHSCDTVHDIVSITSAATVAQFPAFSSTTLSPTYYTIDTATSSFNIQILCGDTPSLTPCLTNSLVINTGYNSVTGTSIAGSPEGGTPVPDPHWKLTAVTPSIAVGIAATPISGLIEVTPGNSADVLQAPSVVTEYSYSNWISCVNSDIYVTDGTGPPPSGTVYNMTLSRCFKTCSADSIKLDLNIADDNYISSLDVDGVLTSFSQPVSMSTTNWSSFAHYTTTLWLTGGSHCINIVVQNYNVDEVGENGFEMNVYGTVSSTTANIYSEDSSCSAYSCAPLAPPCNTLSLADSAQACDSTTIALAGSVTGSDSIISIHWSPATGLSDTATLNPSLTVGTTSGYYYLTAESILPENLIVNGDFNSGNTGFSSDYTYLPSGLSGTGDYIICTNPNTYYSGWPSMGDHTTGTGNMLVIDGSETTGTNFWCQTITVTTGTDYIFTVWIASLQLPLPGDEVTINGTVIGSFTALSTVGEWTKYQVTWNSGSTTSANICMTDTNLSGIGNDFAIDDISFEPICIATDSIYVQVYQTPNAHLGNDTTICLGNAVEIKPVTIAAGDIYTWSTGSATDSISITTTGNYWVSVNNHGCLASDTMHLLVNSAAVNLGADTTICIGQSDVLQSSLAYTSPTYAWSTGATTATINESVAGTYWLTVSQLGCTGSDTMKLYVSPLPHVNLGNDTILCNGSATTLTPTSGVGETYAWSTLATTSTISVSTAGTYWVNVDSNNCHSSDTINIQAYTSTVNLGNDTSICFGQSVTLQSSDPYTIPVYLWSTGDATASINVSAAGSYWLMVTQNGCIGADTINVNTIPIPVVNLGPDTAVCSGVPIELQSLVSYTGATYLWSTGSTAPILTIVTSGIYSLNVTVDGCTGTDSVAVGSKNGTLVLQNHDTAICRGTSIQVLASDSVTATYQWLPTAGMPFSNIADPVITPDTSAMYVLSALVAGCPALEDSFYIDVQPNPIAVFIGGNRMVCHDGTLHISALVNPGWYTHYSYSWSPATYIDDPTSPNIIFANGDTTTLTVTVTTPAGCIGKDSAQILVHANDFLKILNPGGLCPGDSTQLKVTSSESGTTVHWYPPTYLSDSMSLTPWIYPITSQGYTVVGISQYGCLDTASINVTVYPAAVMNLPDSITLYPGESYQMDPVTNCTTISWFPALGLNDIHITNPLAMPDVNTMYIVDGSTEEGCVAVDSVHVIVDPTTLLAVPNAFTPGNGPNNVIKVIKRGIATLHYFRIYNRWGNMVFETNDINTGWDGTYKGTPQAQDVFVYEVEAVTNTGKIFVQQGNITLLR